MSEHSLVPFSPKPVLPASQPAPHVTVSNDGKCTSIQLHDRDVQRQFLSTFATSEGNFAMRLFTGLITAASIPTEQNEQDYNELLSLVHGLAPKDGTEAMLVTQMAATHVATMKALAQLNRSEQTVQRDSNINAATKLMRTFTAQLEALNRYRNAGQQQIVVKHVEVNAQQAVVGLGMGEGVGRCN